MEVERTTKITNDHLTIYLHPHHPSFDEQLFKDPGHQEPSKSRVGRIKEAIKGCSWNLYHIIVIIARVSPRQPVRPGATSDALDEMGDEGSSVVASVDMLLKHTM